MSHGALATPSVLNHSLACVTTWATGTMASMSFMSLACARRSWSPLSKNRSASAGARKETDLDFRQSHARVCALARDPVMARQAKLETTTQRRAGDRRHPRFAACLEAPIEQRQLAAVLEKYGGCGLLAACPCHLGECVNGRFQHEEVRAGTKRLLARGDDRAPDCAIAGDRLDDIGKLLDDVTIDDVHRTAGRVPGDERDAVCVGIELEIDVSHGAPSASVASSTAFRISLARLA